MTKSGSAGRKTGLRSNVEGQILEQCSQGKSPPVICLAKEVGLYASGTGSNLVDVCHLLKCYSLESALEHCRENRREILYDGT